MAIIENMSFEDYKALDGFNSSTIRPYLVSSLHGEYCRKQKRFDSIAMKLGRAIHTLCLEGEHVFTDQYLVGEPINEKTGKPYGIETKVFKEWLSNWPDLEHLTTPQAKKVNLMGESLKNNKKVQKLLKQNPNRETVLTWVDELTGKNCKARLDGWGNDLVDLKSFSKQLDHNALSREIYQRNYHVQMAFYLDGLKANGVEPEHVYFIFIQSIEENDVAICELGYQSIEYGREYYQKALVTYLNAQKGFISGCMPEIETVNIPYWVIENDFDYGNVKFEVK